MENGAKQKWPTKRISNRRNGFLTELLRLLIRHDYVLSPLTLRLGQGERTSNISLPDQ